MPEKQLPSSSQLKRERKLRGWSQAYVAEMIGSDPKTVSRWETGNTLPGPFLLRKLVELFGMSAEALKLLPRIEKMESDVHQFSHTNWGEVPHVESFYGRQEELATLQQWICDDRYRIVTVLGFGGVGKTTLVTAFAEQIKDKFQYVFWRSIQHTPDLKDTLEQCILFLADQQKIDFPSTIDALILLFISYLREHRCLLILDNFESVLRSGNHTGQYQAGCEDYGNLLQRIGESNHQSCLLLTSREKPQPISYLEGKTLPVRSLYLPGIGQAEGQKLLKNSGLFGTDKAWAALVHLYSGNPLALKLLSEPIREVFGGNIVDFLRSAEAVFGDVYELLEQQFQRLSETEQNIMYWLAIEREAVSLQEIQENTAPHVASRMLIEALNSLWRRSMIERNSSNLFTLQPAIMEFLTERFVKYVYGEIESGAINFLSHYALEKAESKEYIRNSQVRFILSPIIEQLLNTFGTIESEKKLLSLLSRLHTISYQYMSYASANLLNMLLQIHGSIRGLDFSHLTIRQAYLQGFALPEVNFTNAHFIKSVFTDTFGSVLCVGCSSVDQLFAAGTVDGEIRIWRATSGTPLLTCSGHTAGIRSIAFCPDGTRLISGSEDHSVKLWNTYTGNCDLSLQGHSGPVRCVAFSSDRKTIASCSEDRTVRLWDSNTGRCLDILQGHTNWIRSVTFNPDGHLLASSSDDQTIRIWESSSGQCLAILYGHTSAIRAITFSPDGRVIASCGNDATVRVWDASTYQCIHVLQGHSFPVRTVACSLDSQLVASAGDDQTVRIWDRASGHCLRILQGHSNRIWSLAFGPTDQTLISGGEDQTVRIWNIHTGHCLRTLQGYSNLIWSIAFSSDLPLVASGDDQFIQLWDVHTGHRRYILQGHINRVRSVAFSPDDNFLASASEDQTLRLWSIRTGYCLKVLQGHTHLVSSIAWSPDSKLLVSSSHDQTIRLWDVNTGQCIRVLQEGNGLLWFVTFSGDGRFIAASGSDRIVRLWTIDTGQPGRSLPTFPEQVYGLAFHPIDTILACASDDHTIQLWNSFTGERLRILQGHTHWVRSVAFSPDGHTLVSGSHDQTVRLWDTRTGECLKILSGHKSWIWSVAFSSKGNIIGSGGNDSTVKLWDAKTGFCLNTLKSEKPYESMNITGAKGFTETQRTALKALGAIDVIF